MPNALLSRRGFVACLAAWPGLALARTRAGAPPLLLAQEAPDDVDPAGHLVSEKYDGARALWDGRTLSFRSGLPVAAPAWFTGGLPAVALDGELWIGRGRFEALSAAVRRHEPRDEEWRQIRYMVFELPGAAGAFAQRAASIRALVQAQGAPQLRAVEQSPLADRAALQRRLNEVVAAGGEGLVLHRADAPYVTGRNAALLKLKPLQDAEARVLAHLPGRGRHAGRLGALRVRTGDGIEFDLGTGLSDELRDHPPAVGSLVSYTFRGRTAAGVPRFASFLRLRSI
jgi:DNA ligase-1